MTNERRGARWMLALPTMLFVVVAVAWFAIVVGDAVESSRLAFVVGFVVGLAVLPLLQGALRWTREHTP